MKLWSKRGSCVCWALASTGRGVVCTSSALDVVGGGVGGRGATPRSGPRCPSGIPTAGQHVSFDSQTRRFTMMDPPPDRTRLSRFHPPFLLLSLLVLLPVLLLLEIVVRVVRQQESDARCAAPHTGITCLWEVIISISQGVSETHLSATTTLQQISFILISKLHTLHFS